MVLQNVLQTGRQIERQKLSLPFDRPSPFSLENAFRITTHVVKT